MTDIPGLEFDAGWQTVRFNGRTHALNRAEAAVLTVLLARLDHVVPRDEIDAALWPDGMMPVDRVGCRRQRVYHLRRKLGDLGVPVEIVCINRGGVGMRLKVAA